MARVFPPDEAISSAQNGSVARFRTANKHKINDADPTGISQTHAVSGDRLFIGVFSISCSRIDPPFFAC